jgi:hypothetical protein
MNREFKWQRVCRWYYQVLRGDIYPGHTRTHRQWILADKRRRQMLDRTVRRVTAGRQFVGREV